MLYTVLVSVCVIFDLLIEYLKGRITPILCMTFRGVEQNAGFDFPMSVTLCFTLRTPYTALARSV